MSMKCDVCGKAFETKDSLNGHKRMHGPTNGLAILPMVCCIETKKEMLLSKFVDWKPFRKECKWCGKAFTTQFQSTTTCSRSCAVAFGNKGSVQSEATRQKIRRSLTRTDRPEKPTKEVRARRIRVEILGPFSKLYRITCQHSGQVFLSRRCVKYHPSFDHLYKRDRNRFFFTFNVYMHPTLFDLEMVKRVGWYSPGGKARGTLNPNGLTRDHRVSVNDAIKNGYDPFYITHPLNCELMLFSDNNRKKTKSSMSYDELVRQVNEYEVQCST